MQPLKDYIILYDEECPMCNLYTGAFVKSGMLEPAGRACYQSMPGIVAGYVNEQRAVNEIALVNRKTGEVHYGIRSLFTIVAHAFPVFKQLFAFGPFVWLMSKVYAFISYNRRVIIPPARLCPAGIQPSFVLRYRIAYLLVTWLATSGVLSHYTLLMTGPVPAGAPCREYLVCGGQIIFQGLVAILVCTNKKWDYLGNMMTILSAGALLLLPALLIAHQFSLSPFFYTVYFLAVAALMFLEHIRRTKLLQLGSALTISWVVYRLAVLLIIFSLG